MFGTTWMPPVTYPAIGEHGVIGDRRTAALVAADGTIDWLCLPDYDGDILFGALLDAEQGGFWRLGPAAPRQGRQTYREESATLVTTWTDSDSELELMDVMAWPTTERPSEREPQRVLLRQLRCTAGQAHCVLDIFPRHNFGEVQFTLASPHVISFRAGSHEAGLWVSHPVGGCASGGYAAFTLSAGEEIWAALVYSVQSGDWSVKRAAEALAETEPYWRQWHHKLSYTGPRRERVQRSAMLIHLMSYAPAGSLVAAPTTSLPERIGGDWCADYRFEWVRDASLSLAVLALLGNTEDPSRYMDWLTTLGSSTDEPLQVLYGIRGEMELPQSERKDLYGYRGSKPVRFRNHAYQQRQLDSLGYFNDCCYVYLEQGGVWKQEYWELVQRLADYTADSWRMPDHGLWELSGKYNYVSGKVMSWVALERAAKIAEKLGHTVGVGRWRMVMDEIHAEVMEQGWSERLGAFKQRYEGDNLDASVLLIPVMGFLPADHPRVLSTLERIAESLAIDLFVHRFDPLETPDLPRIPLGEYEGAFWPCTFWMATACAMAGQTDKSEAILSRAEELAGPLGLIAEACDARTGAFLGNYPLLFSQIEYVRAVMETAKARPLSAARLMVGKIGQKIGKIIQ